MADAEKKILISVQVLDNFTNAKKEVEKYKAALKDAEKQGDKTAEEIRQITSNLAAANEKYKQAKKDIEQAARSQQFFNQVNDQANKSLGELRTELAALKNISFAGLDEQQIAAINQQIADVTAQIKDYKVEIKGLDTGEVFANTAAGLQAVVAGFTVLTSTLSALGVESESLKKVEQSTVQLIAVMQALGVVTEFVEKQKYKLIAANIKSIASNLQEAISKKINALETAKLTAVENTNILSKTRSAIATKALAAAQWLLNAARAADPINLIILAIALLITGIIALIAWTDKNTRAIKAAEKAAADYERQASKTASAIALIETYQLKAIEDRKLAGRKELEELRKKNASKIEIAKKEAEIAKDVRDLEIKYGKDIIDQRILELSALEASHTAEVNRLKGFKGSQKEYDEQAKKVRELAIAYERLKQAIISGQSDISNKEEDNVEDARKTKEEALRLAREYANKQYDLASKTVEFTRKFNEQRLKAEADYQSDDFFKKSAYQQRLFALNQEAEKQQLALQLKYGKIKRSEYDMQLKILSEAQIEFNNAQVSEFNKFYADSRDALLKLDTENVDLQIKEVREKYAKAIEDIGRMQEPLRLVGQSEEDFQKEYKKFEDFMYNKAVLQSNLEKQQAKEIEAINEASLQNRISEIEKQVGKVYDNDLKAFADNEQKKAQIEIEKLRETIDRKKAAGLETAGDEAQLRIAQTNANNLQLSSDLILAGENADAKYKLRREFLLKELELYKGNTAKQIELNDQLKQNDRELMEAKIAQFDEWSSRIGEGLSAINELSAAFDEADIQRTEQASEKKKQSLDSQLAAGIISKNQYDREIAKSDKEVEKQKAIIARNAAIREKAIGVFQIGINTASAIMKNTAQLGFLPALPVNILTGVLGAIQLATVLAKPLPPMPKAAKGMYVKGASHANGGVAIEAEGGEAIMSKRATQMFLPLLSTMNQLGGGVSFTNARFSDGGYAIRNSKRGELTAAELAKAMEQVNIAVAVEDIRREDRRYTEVVSKGNY